VKNEKERVVFQTNVPVTAALAYGDGLKVEGRYGDQVMYSLVDERVMYVPPIVREKLLELGVGPNEPFSICKAEQREGNRRFIEWAVRRLEAVRSSEPADGGPTASVGVPHEASAPVRNDCNGAARPNGKPSTASGSNGAQATLRAALAASIDAALEAERYASEHGLSVRFGSEDLRAMALSLFIQHARDGGGR
jgi:hypothetical protein